MNIFPDANENREFSLNYLLLFREIRSIEENIIIARQNNLLSCVVNNTTMTNNTTGKDYFKVWKNIIENREIKYNMDYVINYFKGKKFNILRKSTNEQTFVWEIFW